MNIEQEKQRIDDTNWFYIDQLKYTYKACLHVLDDLRHKVRTIFWATLILYTILFFIGIALLSIPIISFIWGDISLYTSIISGSLGIIDIATVLCTKPLERIHDLMGDMSQISMVINSYQQQVALRHIEYNYEDKDSIGEAAQNIATATKESLELIQKYVETKPEKEKKKEKDIKNISPSG